MCNRSSLLKESYLANSSDKILQGSLSHLFFLVVYLACIVPFHLAFYPALRGQGDL